MNKKKKSEFWEQVLDQLDLQSQCYILGLPREHPAEFDSYQNMLRRIKNGGYNYQIRGIRVCSLWEIPVLGFFFFFNDMGPRPPGTGIDRVDNNGHYEPGNCRWATPQLQNRPGGRRRPTSYPEVRPVPQ